MTDFRGPGRRTLIRGRTPAVLAAVAIALAGCASVRSIMDPGNVEYRSASTGPALDVPPDLVTPQGTDRYTMPSGRQSRSQSLSDFNKAREGQDAAPRDTSVLPASSVARIERAGNTRWLVVNEPAEVIWPQLKDFWAAQGFTLAVDSPNLGIMETEWAERRQRIETDGLRGILSRTLGSSYATGERDRYRTRLERLPDGRTEIYLTHRGMEEVVTGFQKDSSIWQPRAASPELEVEYLRRILGMLGYTQLASTLAQPAAGTAAAGAAATAGSAGGGSQAGSGTPGSVAGGASTGTAGDAAVPAGRSRLVTEGEVSSIVYAEGFDRAWREVGIVLDRVGFTVEDRDRSKGVYFVRYVDLDRRDPKQGALSRMFTGERKDLAGQRYQIVVNGDGASSSRVGVRDEGGQAPSSPENQRVANRIVSLLNDELK